MREPKLKGKSYDIPNRLVWDARLKVKENGGAAGADGVTIGQFGEDLSRNGGPKERSTNKGCEVPVSPGFGEYGVSWISAPRALPSCWCRHLPPRTFAWLPMSDSSGAPLDAPVECQARASIAMGGRLARNGTSRPSPPSSPCEHLWSCGPVPVRRRVATWTRHRQEAGIEMKTIGTEEHFVTDEVVMAWSRLGSPARDDSRASAPPGAMGERLREVGERRIAAMDEAGLDVQVISLTSPGLHNLPADEATRLQVETNDRIAELVKAHPDRFQGFATLATPAPAAAAQELERAVTKLPKRTQKAVKDTDEEG